MLELPLYLPVLLMWLRLFPLQLKTCLCQRLEADRQAKTAEDKKGESKMNIVKDKPMWCTDEQEAQ